LIVKKQRNVGNFPKKAGFENPDISDLMLPDNLTDPAGY
jgi:hypothetical protein